MKGLFRHAQALEALESPRVEREGGGGRWETFVSGKRTGTKRGKPRFVGKGGTMRRVLILTVAAMLVIATASAAPSPILDFDLTQGSGTTVVDSANGVVGTTHGTLWSTDPSGMPVLYFDNPIVYWFGDGDYFEIPYHNALNSPTMSIEALVYPMSCGYYTVFAERIRDGGTVETITVLGLVATGYHTGRAPFFGLSIGGIGKYLGSPNEIPLNAWSHIVGTYDGNDMRLYVNGILVATEFDVGGPRDTGSNPFYLGHAPSGNHYFNGFYAAFKMYDRALTAEEIAAEFNAPPVANANGPYLGDEGDTITFDASGSSDPDDNIVSYEWDLDNDGEYDDATGVTTEVVFDDDGAFTVGLRVTDEFDESDTDTAEVAVLNVAPAVNAGSDATIYSGETFTVNASFTDPGVLDTHTATIDFRTGDGPEWATVVEEEGSGTVTGSHRYFVPDTYTVEVCVTDDDEGTGCDSLSLEVKPFPVTIDIKPCSYPNSINLKSKGVVPVAVLTTDDFDASTVDPVTVEFADASPLRWATEDVDGDGDVDLLFHFKTQELNLDENSTEATLTGDTTDGKHIKGTDTVNIVPKGK